jgi:peroxiredoxin Q/BCP
LQRVRRAIGYHRGMRTSLIALALLVAAPALAKRPDVGAPAPAFALDSSTGKPIKLADFRGKRTVVLAFFPKAFTGG